MAEEEEEASHERRVRQRTGSSSHDAAAAVLAFLRGVQTDDSFPHGSDGRRILADHLGDIDSIPDETLVDAARAFAEEWSDRYSAARPAVEPADTAATTPMDDDDDDDDLTSDAGELQSMVRRLLAEKRVAARRISELEARNAELQARIKPTAFEWAVGAGAPGRRFDLWELMQSASLDDRISVTPLRLRDAMQREQFVLVQLVKTLKFRQLLVDTREEEDGGGALHEARFVRTSEVMRAAFELCKQELRIRANVPDEDGSMVLFDSVSDEDRFTEKHACFMIEEDFTPLRSLHEHMLRMLRQRGFRKSGDELFEEIFVDGHRTHAWQLARITDRTPPPPSTFDTFFTENVGRYLDYSQYSHSVMFNNRENVIKQLIKENEPECPILQRTRLFISFRNCVMHVLGACFPYDAKHRWPQIAARKNQEIKDFSTMWAAKLNAIGFKVEPFDLEAKTMTDTGESMVVRPPRNDETSSVFIDEDVPVEYMDLRYDGSNFGGDGLDDVNPANPWGSRLFAYLQEVYTPEFDSVQTTQDFDTATRFWDLVMMGRSMLPGKTLDSMHCFSMRQGRAGTGKSMTIQVLEALMPPGKFAVLSNGSGEKTFWSTGLQNVWVLAWLEAQSKVQPPIDRGTFQTMAANEMVNLPQKGEKAVWMRWLAALHVAGNEYPAWEDSSGSLRRRAMTFLYLNKVKRVDVNFEAKMKKRLAPLLVKMMHSYVLMLQIFPNLDWQQIIPASPDGGEKYPIIGQQLADFHRRASENLDPLQAFVNQPGKFHFAPDARMSEQEFVSQYNAYRENMLGIGRAKWSAGHYMIVFESKDITRRQEMMPDPQTGHERSTMALIGIAPLEEED
jgi:hypothetical protein